MFYKLDLKSKYGLQCIYESMELQQLFFFGNNCCQKKTDKCYQLNDHDWGKTFGRVMYDQIKYNYSANFLTYYINVKIFWLACSVFITQ